LPFEGFVIFKDYVTHLEYIRSCAELWEKGLYLELGAYQHHTFMDFRFVESSEWELVKRALNGAGVESMQAKFDEMFGVKEEVRSEKEEVEKIKKPRKKAVKKKNANPSASLRAGSKTKKAAVKKAVAKNSTNPSASASTGSAQRLRAGRKAKTTAEKKRTAKKPASAKAKTPAKPKAKAKKAAKKNDPRK